MIFYEILVIYFLFADLEMLGTRTGKFNIELKTSLFLTPFVVFAYLVFLITFFIFFRHSMISKDPKVRWIGRLILIGQMLFVGGQILDGFMPLTPTAIIIVRVLLISSTIVYYIGWLMPDRIAGWLIKDYDEISKEPTEQKDDVQEFLKLLKEKPEKINEEEVTFYREKKICLVCKGKVGGFNYICTNCDALYCEKCARALARLENACWVCDSPFDESKPVKPYKREEDEVGIEEEILKNGKDKQDAKALK